MMKGVKQQQFIVIEQGFKLVYDSLFASLYGFAIKFTVDKQVAEDIVQDAFLQLWNDRYKFYNLNAVKAFLYKKIRNDSLNHIKHINVRKKYNSEYKETKSNEFFISSIIQTETDFYLYKYINELPPKCKEIVLLNLEGLKNQEIANQLDISVNTVKTQKKIAYKQLRIKLEPVFNSL